jgi:hypothetical protein
MNKTALILIIGFTSIISCSLFSPNTSNKTLEFQKDSLSVSSKSDTLNNNDGYWFVEHNASFKGGDLSDFNLYLKEHLDISCIGESFDIASSKIIVQFSIDTLGNVCDIKILKNLAPSCDESVIKLFRDSPKWKPAMQGGKKVKQIFTVPMIVCFQ